MANFYFFLGTLGLLLDFDYYEYCYNEYRCIRIYSFLRKFGPLNYMSKIAGYGSSIQCFILFCCILGTIPRGEQGLQIFVYELHSSAKKLLLVMLGDIRVWDRTRDCSISPDQLYYHLSPKFYFFEKCHYCFLEMIKVVGSHTNSEYDFPFPYL